MTVVGEPTNMEEEDEKPRTLLIGNIPRSTHKREIEEIFGEVGPLKRCYIQYPRDDKKKRPGDQSSSTLLCYVTFALAEDALKALETLGSHKIGGSKVHIKFAKTRSEQVRPKFIPDSTTTLDNDVGGGQEKEGRNKRKRFDDNDKEDEQTAKIKNPNMIPVRGVTLERPKPPKGPRPKPINKKSRLIVRNLSFKVTDEKMKEYFGVCGDIKDINILKKPDGKLVGCAFVQFDTVAQAAKAVRDLNLKPFLGRPIAIDWALPKKDFQDKDEKQGEGAESTTEVVKVESDDDGEDVKIKQEPLDDDKSSAVIGDDDDDVKFINPYTSMPMDIKIEDGDDKRTNRKRKIKEESDEEDQEEDFVDSEEEEEVKPKTIKIPRKTNDVEEGKTLFLRNLDFGVTEDDLKSFFEAYGQLHYSLLCKDHLTEHPKGTGFVKFKNLADATKCLTDFNIESTKFKLSNRNFTIAVALPKERLTSNNAAGDKKEEKIKQDNRNLYLVREGFIRPQSSAAEGVSIMDMNKRAALNSTKKQMLKNLSIFASPTRLCVHNLPVKLTDKALRRLFKKFSSAEARITEARIMRDMKDIQLGGKGKSKGFGFVTFKEHEHALAALRAINNNPEVFSPTQRPIVEFSLENRKALQAKEKRMQKSVENNKMAPKKKPKIPKSTTQKQPEKNATDSPAPKPAIVTKPKRKPKTPKSTTQQQPENTDTPPKSAIVLKPKNKPNPKTAMTKQQRGVKPVEGNDNQQRQYTGLTGKRGISKLPVMKAKGPVGKISRKSLKDSRSLKKKLQERRNREPQIKPKQKIDRSDKSEQLLAKHKSNMEKASGGGGKKSKWYK